MPVAVPSQRSFDDLGEPLNDVTFCVLDIETTGGDRGADAITEFGAVKVRGGACLGTLHTMVNPGRAIPPTITVLTGITDAMVVRAPAIDEVLPTIAEFIGNCVVVGHNVGFDLAFINAALARRGDPPLSNQVVDTLPLARRLVRDEVPDCRLGTLATRFRLDHRPTHRALDDALATTDVLHLLLERAAGLGVLGLDDLLALPRLGNHPQAGKLRLTTHLPRTPGVYLFHGAADRVLYVGKATNLRQRVRSYFGGDDRRKIGTLLREAQRISHIVTPDVITAEVLELRLLHHHLPRYNRVGTTSDRYCYVRLSTNEAWPRLSVVNSPSRPGLVLGPISSRAAATAFIEAVQSALPLRRCTQRVPRSPDAGRGHCTSAQLGVATCPCTGDADEGAYQRVVADTIRALTTQPELVTQPLEQRMWALAAQQRYEEAALTRDRIAAFAAVLQRQSMIDGLRQAGDAGVQVGSLELHLTDGVLVGVREAGQIEVPLPLPPPDIAPTGQPLPRQALDEVLMLARALQRHAPRSRLLWCTGAWPFAGAEIAQQPAA